MVRVTPEGRDVIFQRRPARLLLPPIEETLRSGERVRSGERAAPGRKRREPAARTPSTRAGAQSGAIIESTPSSDLAESNRRARPDSGSDGRHGDVLDDRGLALFQALRAYRLEEARRSGVPPYVVASDRTLRDIASLRPANLEQLRIAHGIGPAKAERYGEALLDVVRRFETRSS